MAAFSLAAEPKSWRDPPARDLGAMNRVRLPRNAVIAAPPSATGTGPLGEDMASVDIRDVRKSYGPV